MSLIISENEKVKLLSHKAFSVSLRVAKKWIKSSLEDVWKVKKSFSNGNLPVDKNATALQELCLNHIQVTSLQNNGNYYRENGTMVSQEVGFDSGKLVKGCKRHLLGQSQ